MTDNQSTSYMHSYDYNDMVCEDSKRAAVKAIKQETYCNNLNSYYRQDSSDYKAVSNNNKTKAELDIKYSKYIK
ncbi:hypothetical protein [Photobacterium kishitanii]|uniref:hypothetical protein n=1 Tax=Photobacterium kishitanii TaxID=318456 RepID=UPI000D1776F7|nr:hypothetical protein [Photobacterium kishitanii]PSV15401.1 hypothetical protein C0W28_15555 [Photobacterium kishitanii]